MALCDGLPTFECYYVVRGQLSSTRGVQLKTEIAHYDLKLILQ